MICRSAYYIKPCLKQKSIHWIGYSLVLWNQQSCSGNRHSRKKVLQTYLLHVAVINIFGRGCSCQIVGFSSGLLKKKVWTINNSWNISPETKQNYLSSYCHSSFLLTCYYLHFHITQLIKYILLPIFVPELGIFSINQPPQTQENIISFTSISTVTVAHWRWSSVVGHLSNL